MEKAAANKKKLNNSLLPQKNPKKQKQYIKNEICVIFMSQEFVKDAIRCITIKNNYKKNTARVFIFTSKNEQYSSGVFLPFYAFNQFMK